MAELPPRTIMVKMVGQKRRMVSNIPGDAKITFGPVSPGSRDIHGQNALRIYTSKENQLAVFVGVEEFRDLTLTVQDEKITKKLREDSTRDSSGQMASSEYEEKVEWEDA